MNEPAPARSVLLPLLALPFRPTSLSPWALSEAARDTCRVLWIVDDSAPVDPQNLRLLRRLGDVLELGGDHLDQWSQRLAERDPRGIVAFSDHNMVAIAHAAAALGLRFHSPETARLLTDKHLQRTALARAGLEVPRAALVPPDAGRDELEAFASGLSYPSVLKPRHGADSRLTFRVDGPDQLLRLLASDELASSDLPMVVEAYLEDAPPVLGDGIANYLSVESFVDEGRARHFATTGRLPPAEPFRESGFFIPSTLHGTDLEAVLAMTTSAARALGIEHGFLHTEIKLTPRGPKVIEVNGRLGGGVPAMYELLTGVSLLRQAMRDALGHSVALGDLDGRGDVAYRLLVQAPTWAKGVAGVDGLDKLSQMPGVHAVSLNRPPGSPLDWRLGNRDYVFAVLGTAGSHKALRRTLDDIRAIGRVRYTS